MAQTKLLYRTSVKYQELSPALDKNALVSQARDISYLLQKKNLLFLMIFGILVN